MIIIGAKGFAKEVLEILHQNNIIENLYFFDDISELSYQKLYNKFTILNSIEEANTKKDFDSNFILGIGGTNLREKLFDLFLKNGFTPYTLISPYANIGHYNNEIGKGCTIMTGVVITNDIKIGIGTLVNLNVTIGHDTKIGKFCDIMPGVNISGNVTIGNYCKIGTGSVILPNIKIGENVTVGAGAVVNKNITDNQTVIGIPAKPLNK